ncbi:hypothetical protein [Streptomyces sp. HUAS TT7]|uniref:hypothetical protein n=1 Tax=Streptomyces sp. HUAS TT7 TaxID=3447507 RepID=UPI003F65B803
MTPVHYSDEADKVLTELTRDERAAVTDVRASLELDPHRGDRRPGYDPDVEEGVVRLTTEQTRGRGVSVLYRYHRDMDAVLITWLIVGP